MEMELKLVTSYPPQSEARMENQSRYAAISIQFLSGAILNLSFGNSLGEDLTITCISSYAVNFIDISDCGPKSYLGDHILINIAKPQLAAQFNAIVPQY